MSSEADIQKLVEAAREVVAVFNRSNATAIDWEEGAELSRLQKSLAPFAAERGKVQMVRIYSHSVGAWWRQNGGYVDDKAAAGQFAVEDAIRRIGDGSSWRCGQTPREGPADCIVPVLCGDDAPTTGRNAPMYDPADVAFKPATVAAPPSPSPSVPTPEQMAEKIARMPHGGIIALAAIITADRAAVTATLRARLEALEADHLRACQTVAAMHAAAVGEVRGPIRGVVEDIADLRAKLAETEDKLRNETGACEMACRGIEVLKAKLAEAESESEYRRTMWMRTKDERNDLTAKLAAGGGDAELLETARTVIPVVVHGMHDMLVAGKASFKPDWHKHAAEDAVSLASSLHAALTAKGAERG